MATLAVVAIWLTPALEKKQIFPMEPVVVTRPGVEPADFMLTPLLVEASNTELVDTLAISGVIQSSLYNALNESGVGVLPPSARHKLAWSLADIFEYKVDMSRDLRQGDKFHLLVERLQKPNGAIIVNKVLGARLALSGGKNPLEAIAFNSRGSNSSQQYYDASGVSLRSAFLRAPVAFRRISSIFGSRRKHPIFGQWRNHTGTDYAAPTGTPIRAIGDGFVVFAGRKGGYGNVIDIRHRNGMVSRYGHMRNFAAGHAPRNARHHGQHDRLRRLDRIRNRPAPAFRDSRWWRRARSDDSRCRAKVASRYLRASARCSRRCATRRWRA